MNTMTKWQRFSADPFSFVDNIHLSIRGNDINLFVKFHKLQKMALALGLVFLAMWGIFGFDSNPLQLIIPLYEVLPGVITGHNTWADMGTAFNYYYGKEMHYSAFVIYLLLWFFISKNYEKAGIIKTKNVIYSSAVMLLAISVFEWFWILGFGIFQNQPWVYTWQFPQLRILLQNLMFFVAGGLTIFYIWIDSYQLNGKEIIGRNFTFNLGSRLLWILIGLSIAVAIFWIYYPGPVTQITVTLDNGQLWHSSRLFPQTLYTVALDPGIINAGSWYYVENNVVHAVNTIVKVLWAATAYMLLKVKKVET